MILPCLIQVPLLLSLAVTLPPPLPPTIPVVLQVLSPGAAGIVSSSSSIHPTATENYLPRRLYPGTYKNYCGPTPEITVRNGCTAHGWHGDDALDDVDEACRLHDVSYCSCEAKLLSRQDKRADEQIPGLSSLVALRFITLPAAELLNTANAIIDDEYLECIHKADVNLITKGITIRQQQQQSNCESSSLLSSSSLSSPLSSSSGSVDDDDDDLSTAKNHKSNSNNKLKWFCQLDEDSTLSAFEKVSLAIFLRNLDFDQQTANNNNNNNNINSNKNSQQKRLLTQLESKRQDHFMAELKRGKSIAAAMASPAVQQDEQEMLHILQLMTAASSSSSSSPTP